MAVDGTASNSVWKSKIHVADSLTVLRTFLLYGIYSLLDGIDAGRMREGQQCWRTRFDLCYGFGNIVIGFLSRGLVKIHACHTAHTHTYCVSHPQHAHSQEWFTLFNSIQEYMVFWNWFQFRPALDYGPINYSASTFEMHFVRSMYALRWSANSKCVARVPEKEACSNPNYTRAKTVVCTSPWINGQICWLCNPNTGFELSRSFAMFI